MNKFKVNIQYINKQIILKKFQKVILTFATLGPSAGFNNTTKIVTQIQKFKDGYFNSKKDGLLQSETYDKNPQAINDLGCMACPKPTRKMYCVPSYP